MMPCQHTIYDTCACIFGQRSHGAEYHFDLACCLICLKQFLFVVRVLPPTKGPTVLVLDGGGIRGVVTLGFLKVLEEEIGALRGAFDLTVGTSAGECHC
jgi:predicted acylesterase/phospholipase RssA